jgi:hypothetical protein
MKLSELSSEDQELVRAFVEIAQAECGGSTWNEVEPMLASCWEEAHRQGSRMEWRDIAAYVRSACEDALRS